MQPTGTCALAFALLSLAPVAAAQDAAALYRDRCQSCHEGAAASRAPARAVIAALPVERIVQSLESGVMREQGAGLSAAERQAIARFISTAAAASAPAGSTAATCAPGQPLRAPGPGDWSAWGITPANERFQRQPGFTAEQVPQLKLKWAFGFDGENAAATQPTIVGGRVFVGSGSGRVYSLDANDGCQHWMFRADAGVRSSVVIGQSGAAGSGLLAFFGDGRATVYALDAATGALRWKQRLDEHRAARITGSPVVHDGRVYVPVSSSEEATGASPGYECCTFRGSVAALDAATGDKLWQTFTIPEPAQPTVKNRIGTQLHGPSGAAVWHAPTLDPATGSLYIATGDAYTAPAAPTSDAIMALDLQTGRVKWSRQMLEGDAWNMSCGTADPSNCPEKEGPDFDFGQPPILVSLANGRRVLVAAQKSGKIHALDPDADGRVLWSLQVAKGGLLGGFEWGSASDGQYFYAPASDIAFNNPAIYARGGVDPNAGGGVFALRVSDGTIAWKTPAQPCTSPCSPAQPAPASVVPGALFAGSLDGHLRAYSTQDGKILWAFDTAREFPTVNGVRASGGSIDVGGPAVGNGMVLTTSGYGQWGGKRGNVLLAFGIE
jgi:polyvinyl alcohol dehydrogenase (cytochrome)